MATRKETQPAQANPNAPAGNTRSNERPVEPGLEERGPGRPTHPPNRPPPPPAGTPGRGTPGRGRRNSDQPPPGSSAGGPTVPDPGTGRPEDLEDVTHAPHLNVADAGREARVAPLGLAVRIARTTLTRRVQTAHRAMNNYLSNSPSPYLREVLYQAKTCLLYTSPSPRDRG